MSKFLIGSALALALSSTSLSAAPVHGVRDSVGPAGAEKLWLAKGNNGNGNKGNSGNGKKLIKKGHGNSGKGTPGKGNAQSSNGSAKPGKGNAQAGNAQAGNGKPEHAVGPKAGAKGNGAKQASNGNGKGADGRRVFTQSEREEGVSRLISTPAPAGRDMTRILGATALALATPQLLVSDIPEDELITYSNCPPGLAKKDPPCVPPGLAKDGVSYQDWASYDRERYDDLWIERRNDWLDSDINVDPDPEYLLLQSDQIATLFDLDPAPQGKRYALIDGMPVLLDHDDYKSLLLVNQLAQVRDLSDGPRIAPTAALTQDELIDLYRLPRLDAGRNYSVLNGQIVELEDSEYELLQMLRIARAIL
ncbi:hypothetical protein [Salipiger sp. PrR002]|uniref:hypothetical protein n=1 Tax=Salipiger sp. PrR002 TaxID=2706489 RepID=UPI0013BD7056|nr:hypothetical protein [Salipiger sp. PrR002]NDV99372.1 hypothetical protein [Salipiger sp. PrR002]NDW55858.1 hypothetical protein [Salipiger sp. PrR004]